MTIRAIDSQAAAGAFAGLAALDPRGMLTDADIPAMCDRGQAFELAGPAGRAVYLVETRNACAWVSALAGQGDGVDLVRLVDGALTHQAAGLQRIALQTARPGLVRRLQRLGYRVTGWVMAKELTPCH